MSKPVVLVTGATGLLGSHVVELLLERGESVRALVRPEENADELARRGVEICWGDLDAPPSLAPAVSGVDRVLHCAARIGIWGPRRFYETTNVRGVEALLAASIAAGVRRFVHVSSHVVCGADVGGVADETAPMRIDPNPYSWSKVMGERVVQRAMADQNAPATIVRPGFIYGPRDSASFARFATLVQQGKMVLIGSGENHVPLIYARDAAEGILRASEAPQAVGRTYLLVNDERVTQRQYLAAIAAELGVAPPGRRIPYRLAIMMGAAAELAGRVTGRPQPPRVTRFGVQILGGENCYVIDRARQELGFRPRTNLAEGVRISAAWFRANRMTAEPHAIPQTLHAIGSPGGQR